MKKIAALLTVLSLAAFSIGCGEGDKPVANGNGTPPASHEPHDPGMHDPGMPGDELPPADPLDADPVDPADPADPDDVE